jgi:uncharacterized protein YndB with AHSA1/START domain
VDLNFYRFRTRWDVDAPPADIYAALEAIEQYPEWWPEVRAADRLGEARYRMRVRSLLPYDLNFVGTRSERDPRTGVLGMRMEGDLDGFSRWTITPLGGGATVTFNEEVVANKALLRRLAVLGRPAFQANHALMMRHCRSGLRDCLAGMHLARTGAG